jgi:23S rRNA pseudouridine2605 synthase
LSRFLAHSGIASRRSAELLVDSGRVTVDRTVVRDPAFSVDEGSHVEVDGVRVAPEPREVHMLNKPAGVVSTARDTHGRRTVVDLVPSERRLYPVGRLDADTTGLILLTNDGDLANRLIHPRYEVPKAYRARIAPPDLTDGALEQLREGVDLDDGRTAPADVRRAGRGTLEITLHEGRKRQVRRMLEVVGHRVVGLERIAFGPLTLGSLTPGEHRLLSSEEVERLWKNPAP